MILYLFEPANHRIAMVDVTHPSKPLVEGQYQESSGLTPTGLSMVNSHLALLSSSPGQNQESAAGSVSLLDLSNPTEPRVEQNFTNVQAYLADSGAGLLYVVTPRHLTVISEPRLLSVGARDWYDDLNAR